MSHHRIKVAASCALAALIMLLVTGVAGAQGLVTPSFGDGQLALVGDGYRPGERVDITVRAAGASHRFTVMADSRGRFRLDTALVIAPLSSLEIEATDEQGQTQVTITSAPGGLPGSMGDDGAPPVIQDDAGSDPASCTP